MRQAANTQGPHKMTKGTVISLFDYSGNAVRDWARAGYVCHCFDIVHKGHTYELVGDKGGVIHYHPADLNYDGEGWALVCSVARTAVGHKVLFAWPPCEDMTVSGNRHAAGKLAQDPRYVWKAKRRATRSAAVGRKYGFAWMVENPVGRLSTAWRKPDAIWNPYEYGGYLPEDDVHPVWPAYIAPRDAYTKKTGAWLGGGFKMPEQRPVTPEVITRTTKSGRVLKGSRQFFLLGGKSEKTKAIRNLGARGACKAFYLANAAA
jgi:hypothetical protein